MKRLDAFENVPNTRKREHSFFPHQGGDKSSSVCTVRVIARNLAVFSNVTLTKNLYGIRKSGHFTYSWYNNYYSRSCVFFIADMLQILAAVKTSRSPCVVKILQYIFFIFFSLLFCMAERGNAED